MDWHFPKSDPAGDVNIASYSRTVIEGERTISGLEIFVREVLQNSLDAAIRADGLARKVTVDFRLREAHAHPQSPILQAMGWNSLRPHLEAAQRASERRMDRYQFPKPGDLENHEMQVLEIKETNTIGLVGPERIEREEDYFTMPGQTPKAYRALCRDDARREKISLGAGGTFGLGKAVLWRASAIQTVLFFSRLSTQAGGVFHRAAAQARLCTHYVPPSEYRGLGFGGQMETGFCAPLRERSASMFARALGLDLREQPQEVGTSIIIPFWERPRPRRDDEEVETIALLARYAARYFWPAIVEGRLEVTATNGRTTINANDCLVLYAPFIDLYGRVRNGQHRAGDAPVEDIPLTVPPGPPSLRRSPDFQRERQTRVRCAMRLVNTQDPSERVQEELLSRVAEIRGQGMVIGYQRLTGRARVKPFVGLALGGQMADSSDGGVRGDMLLGYSEHVTHTRWDEDAEALDSWPQSRSQIRSLLERIAGYFDRYAGIETPEPTGDLSDLQRGLIFPGAERGPDPPPPPGGTPHLRVRRFVREDNHYAFELRARVESGNQPMHVDFWLEAGVETGRASKEDRLDIQQQLRTVPPHLRTERFGNRSVRVHLPQFQADTDISITGKTETLPPDLLSVTAGQLKAKIQKFDTVEEPEQPPTGERTNAES
jgi:hypothetical protein